MLMHVRTCVLATLNAFQLNLTQVPTIARPITMILRRMIIMVMEMHVVNAIFRGQSILQSELIS